MKKVEQERLEVREGRRSSSTRRRWNERDGRRPFSQRTKRFGKIYGDNMSARAILQTYRDEETHSFFGEISQGTKDLKRTKEELKPSALFSSSSALVQPRILTYDDCLSYELFEVWILHSS